MLFTGKGMAGFASAKVFVKTIGKLAEDISDIRLTLDGVGAFLEVIGDISDLVKLVLWDVLVLGINCWCLVRREA